MKQLVREFFFSIGMPALCMYLFLWGGAVFPITWQQNRGIDVAATNCWLMTGVVTVVGIFCAAWLLNVFNVRRPYAMWALSLSAYYGLIAYGGALLHMYGVTSSLHKFANDKMFFLLFFLSALSAMLYNIWKSIVYTAG